MEHLGSYVLRISACGVLLSLAQKLCPNSRGVSWLCALVMALQLLSPLKSVSLVPQWDLDTIRNQACAVTDQAKQETRQEIRSGIIQRTRAYILDEAQALGASLHVVALGLQEDGDFPVSVELEGYISPYARSVLSRWIEENLGIGKEAQQWKIGT